MRHNFAVALVMGGCLFLAVPVCSADVLYLKNGRSIEGRIRQERGGYIELEALGGILKFRIDQVVRRIEKPFASPASAGQSSLPARQNPAEEKAGPSDTTVTVEVLLNGTVRAKLIVDTGAAVVVLRRPVVEKLGIDVDAIKDVSFVTLGDGSQSAIKSFVLDKIEISRVVASGVPAAVVLDETPLPEGSHDGVLGMSFLSLFKFTVDSQENKLIFQ